MKLNYIVMLCSAMLWSGTVNAQGMNEVSTASTQVKEYKSIQQLRGADADISYTVFEHADGKYHIDFAVVADDKDSELMQIMKSGKSVNLSTSQERLVSTRVVDTQKLRGTVVITLRSDVIDEKQMKKLAAAQGETLRLGAEGYSLVKFPVDGDLVLADIAKLMPAAGAEVNNVETAPVVGPASTVTPVQDEALKQIDTGQPKKEVQGIEYKKKNENGLFKIEGTYVAGNGMDMSTNMLRVQESLMRTRECKTAAMNMSTGGLYIYSNNGYCTTAGFPKSLIDALRALNVPNSSITEVAITELNKWVIIYEKSGYKTSTGLPKDMLDQLQQSNLSRHHFKSIVMTDEGEWAIVTNKGYWCSAGRLKEFVDAAVHKMGSLQAVHVTPQGSMLAVCKNGVVTHNVPAMLVEALKTINFVPRVVKYTVDGRYIITDGRSQVEYNL